MSVRLDSFRPSIWLLLGAVVALLVLIMVGVRVGLTLAGVREMHAPGPIPVACLSVGSLMILSTALFPVHVHTDGLRSYNFWGIYQLVEWERVAAVGPVSRVLTLGLPVLSVYSRDYPRPIYIPLILTRIEEFTWLLRAHAGRDHVIVRAIEENQPNCR